LNKNARKCLLLLLAFSLVVRILFFMLYFEASMFMAVISLGCLVCNNNTWASKIPSNAWKGEGRITSKIVTSTILFHYEFYWKLVMTFRVWFCSITAVYFRWPVILSPTSKCGHKVWKQLKLTFRSQWQLYTKFCFTIYLVRSKFRFAIFG